MCERLEGSDLVLELTTTQTLTESAPLGEHAGVLSQSAHWNGQPVFVKTLSVDDPEALARFRHEGRVAAALHHPQIVPLLAMTPTQLIFPYLKGYTLREVLQMTGPLQAAQATELTLGLLGALGYMHGVGVTHQDLKPENVLLLGGERRWDAVRIVDFGMSHSRHLPLDIHSGTRMGTPHFMAPEQFQGERGNPRSDLYSVGVLLFDCLAGHPPYEDALGWLAGIHQRRAPLPGPPALHPVMLAALSRHPEGRPSSAAAMQQAICAARAEWGLPLPSGLALQSDLCP